MSLTDPPVYRPDLFVNRENEIKAVTNALQNIARGDSEQMRTIVFRGERGLGKSWLALHLHRSVLKDEALPNYRIVSLFVRLAPLPEGLTVDKQEWHITDDDASRIAEGDERHYELLSPLQKG
jgi:DNA replication protein DnaC